MKSVQNEIEQTRMTPKMDTFHAVYTNSDLKIFLYDCVDIKISP